MKSSLEAQQPYDAEGAPLLFSGGWAAFLCIREPGTQKGQKGTAGLPSFDLQDRLLYQLREPPHQGQVRDQPDHGAEEPCRVLDS